MESRAKLLGHPIHPIFNVFPVALFSTAASFDVIGLVTASSVWHEAAFLMISVGLLTAVVAAVAGLVDWLAIPAGTRAKSLGLRHGLGNVVIVVLFAVSWLLRLGKQAEPGTLAILLALVGAGLLVVTGWLGGELNSRHGVGVDRGAHLDAPNSWSGRPASGPR